MTEEGAVEGSDRDSEIRSGILNRARQILFQVLLIAGILLVSSGRLDWGWAWTYLGLYLVGIAVNAAILLRTHPELIVERAVGHAETKAWDRRLTRLSVPLWIAMLLIAGLDLRWGWSPPLPLALRLAGLVVVVLGSATASWAMLSNAYFSTGVRIQEERGHRVVSKGPYRYVRHPGYSGFSLSNLGLPLMLGSAWALIPGGLLSSAMIIRTVLEDRTLHEELEGYEAYARKVRYRLIPGIW